MNLIIHTVSGETVTLNNISNALSSSITARLKAATGVIDLKGGHDNYGKPVEVIIPVANINYVEKVL